MWKTTLACAALALSSVAAQAATCSEPNSIAKVRNRAPSGPYEYVVFDYIKPPTLPSFAVTTENPPFEEDGSGEVVAVAGAKFKQIRFQGVFWTCEIKQIINVPRRAVKDVKRTGQFEAIVTFVVGYRAASQFAGSYSYDAGGIRKIVLRFKK